MFLQFLRKLNSSAMYVQIWENRIKITDIQSGDCFDEEPLVAIRKPAKGTQAIVAIGNKAHQAVGPDVILVNPFSHPRSLISDFPVGEKLLNYIFKELSRSSTFRPSPQVVIQPMEKTEGGLTGTEYRAFRELAAGAGARDVVVYQGAVLDRHLFDFMKIKADWENHQG